MFSKFKFSILKILALISIIFITGCAVTAQKVGENKYRVDCSGMMRSTGECYAEAERVCNGKFTEIAMRIDDRGDVYDNFCQCYIWVVNRNLTFACR